MQNLRPDYNAEEQQLASALPTRKAACPPLDVLRAVGQDVLPADVEKAASAHIATCNLCSGLLADLATLPEAAMTASEQQRFAAKLPLTQQRSSRQTILLIAALLLVCLGGFIALHNHRPAPTQTAGHPAPLVSSPATVAELSIPLTPLAPPQDAAILTRGTQAGPEPAPAALLAAFNFYNRADYTTATQKFTTLANSYPNSATIHLYLGVSELYLGQDTQAQSSLSQAAAAAHSPSTTNAALWYSAIAASRLHSPQAWSILKQLCNGHDPVYSAKSCALLKNSNE